MFRDDHLQFATFNSYFIPIHVLVLYYREDEYKGIFRAKKNWLPLALALFDCFKCQLIDWDCIECDDLGEICEDERKNALKYCRWHLLPTILHQQHLYNIIYIFHIFLVCEFNARFVNILMQCT